jgi:hypothetical protein
MEALKSTALLTRDPGAPEPAGGPTSATHLYPTGSEAVVEVGDLEPEHATGLVVRTS